MATKKQSAEQQNAIERLRETLKPGMTVYTILRHVSRSGMQREISLHLPVCQDGRADVLWLTGYAATAMNERVGKRDGIVIGGCGMDMGFAIVYDLSQTLFGDGYVCIGEGCPSASHANREEPPADGSPWVHRDGYALKHRWM